MRSINKSVALMAMMQMMVAGAAPTLAAVSGQTVVNAPAEPTQKQRPQQDIQRVTRGVRRATGGYDMTRGDYRRAGRGWSNKHVQRMAKKSRNVTRARKANK